MDNGNTFRQCTLLTRSRILPSSSDLAIGTSRNSVPTLAMPFPYFPLELGSVKRPGLAAGLTLNQGRPQGFEVAMLAGLVPPDQIAHILAVVTIGSAVDLGSVPALLLPCCHDNSLDHRLGPLLQCPDLDRGTRALTSGCKGPQPYISYR